MPTIPASPPPAGDADAQVEAVLDVLAPRADTVWFIGQDPAEPPRVPIFYLDYQGQPVTPNHDQLYDVARAIVTAVRTASAPDPRTPQQREQDHAEEVVADEVYRRAD